MSTTKLWKCSICNKQFQTKKHRFEIVANIEKFNIFRKHLKQEHNIKGGYIRFITRPIKILVIKILNYIEILVRR
jgi:glycerate-2-kinase